MFGGENENLMPSQDEMIKKALSLYDVVFFWLDKCISDENAIDFSILLGICYVELWTGAYLAIEFILLTERKRLMGN